MKYVKQNVKRPSVHKPKMHCYGDSRLVRHDENREPGLADKLRCSGILAQTGMRVAELEAASLLPARGKHSRQLAVVSIGGNDIEDCSTPTCVQQVEDSVARVVERLSMEYDSVAVLGPPCDYRHNKLPLTAADLTDRMQQLLAPYSNAAVVPLDDIPVTYTSDNVHFDDATNTRVANKICAFSGNSQVCKAHTQPSPRTHCKMPKRPLQAALAQVHPYHSRPVARAHFRVSRWPPLAARK